MDHRQSPSDISQLVQTLPFLFQAALPPFGGSDGQGEQDEACREPHDGITFLEQRFNLASRLVASALFMLFHIGRVAIVLYLPALYMVLRQSGIIQNMQKRIFSPGD